MKCGFDDEFNGDMGGAGFKFTSLQLIGNPTISTANGEINLALIAVNGITSGGPGGTLTFAGLRGLLLATQNGSIDLGPGISFAGLHDITFYARGSGSTLNLAADVSTSSKIRLYAEGGIQLSSDLSTQDLIAFTGGDFIFSAGSIDADRIDIFADGDINFALGTPLTLNTSSIHLTAQGDILADDSLTIVGNGSQSGGSNLVFFATGDINIDGDLSLTTRPDDTNLGGIISVASSKSVIIGGALTLLVDNSNGGHIGVGGDIFLTTDGDLTANSIDALINNRNGGSIDSGGNIFSTSVALLSRRSTRAS